MDIKRIFTTTDISNVDGATTDSPIQKSQTSAEGLNAVPDQIESHSSSDGISALIDVTIAKARDANEEALQGADRQRELISQKEKLRAAQEKLEKMQEDLEKAKDNSSWDLFKSFFGDDAGVGNDAGATEKQNQFNPLISAAFRSDVGSLFLSLDAMHGEPQNYEELQNVVGYLQNLLNSLQIPNEQKLKLQAELNQLDQISHQVPIQPQDPDQNFQAGLQLLAQIRSDFAQYVS